MRKKRPTNISIQDKAQYIYIFSAETPRAWKWKWKWIWESLGWISTIFDFRSFLFFLQIRLLHSPLHLQCTCTCILFFSQLFIFPQLQKQSTVILRCCGGLDYPRSWSFLHWPISHFISSLEFQPSSLLCLCLFHYTFCLFCNCFSFCPSLPFTTLLHDQISSLLHPCDIV